MRSADATMNARAPRTTAVSELDNLDFRAVEPVT
jgi:hypothetical protein